MATDEKYQGWTNHATWCVNLWLNNEEGSQSYWLERAKELRKNPPPNEVWTKEERVRFALANELKESHEEDDPLNQAGVTPYVYSDLLSAALEDVNWDEIARSLLDDD